MRAQALACQWRSRCCCGWGAQACSLMRSRPTACLCVLGTSAWVSEPHLQATCCTLGRAQGRLANLLPCCWHRAQIKRTKSVCAAGDAAGGALWAVALYYCSPLQLLLLFLGRFEVERPSDGVLRLLGRTAGLRCAWSRTIRMTADLKKQKAAMLPPHAPCAPGAAWSLSSPAGLSATQPHRHSNTTSSRLPCLACMYKHTL